MHKLSLRKSGAKTFSLILIDKIHIPEEDFFIQINITVYAKYTIVRTSEVGGEKNMLV